MSAEEKAGDWAISIHAPAKGATAANNIDLSSPLDFNPRSREGSDRIVVFSVISSISISIHAPAKGATIAERTIKPVLIFQSTLPRRERLTLMIVACGGTENISIHAPAKGATRQQIIRLHCERFQSTLPRRERQNNSTNNDTFSLFQSTLPRRERHDRKTKISRFVEFQSTLPRRERLHFQFSMLRIKCHFNPRSREGSDLIRAIVARFTLISIHAPAKGATARVFPYLLT